MEKKKYIKFIKNKREMGKIILYLVIAIMLVFSMKAIATEILANSESVIADEKTIVRTAASVSRGASSSNKVEIASLTTELGRYASTSVTSLSTDIIQVTFNRTGNKYEIDVNKGPKFDILEQSLPYLPMGYTPVEGTDLETGFVIEDGNGNQFVWVEVPRTTTVYPTAGLEIKNFTSEEFEKIEADLKTYIGRPTATSHIDEYYEGIGLTENEYYVQKKKMLKSVYKNEGFYVGRYELGIDYSNGPRTAEGEATNQPVIKKDAYPYNYIGITQAQELAKSFETSGYQASMMFVIQWDLIRMHLVAKGISEAAMNTSEIGNNKDSAFTITNPNARYSTDEGITWKTDIPYQKTSGAAVIVTTGASEKFNLQNIYDLGGNLTELTLGRAFLGGPEVSSRGGWYKIARSTADLNCRNAINLGDENDSTPVGTRVCLYKDEGIYTPDENNQPPYIPNGYTAVDGTMEDGFVIADQVGNEYVWVEVPQTVAVYPTAGLSISAFTEEEFNKIENDLNTYTSVYRKSTTYTDTWSSEEATGLTESEYYILKKKMLKSIYKNGGFYVGRYETGIENSYRTSATTPSETPVIKQNAYPYNYVTPAQAQELSRRFETEDYTTSLMFGVQWDLVLKYLETTGAATQEELITDSTSWGNYNNNLWNITNTNSKYSSDGISWTNGAYGEKNASKSILLTTGARDTFSKQNIYDLAGNTYEWTLEYTSNSSLPITTRGGNYTTTGSSFPSRIHVTGNITVGFECDGFRVALYKDEGTSTLDVPTYIPYGYAHVAGTDMASGFVVEDESGNQYVWVEVPRTASVYRTAGTNVALFTDAEFEKIENDLETYTSVYKTGPAAEGYNFIDEWTQTIGEVTGLSESEYNIQKKKMLKSIYKNGGFYVGRYETGVEYSEGARGATTDPLTQTPVIKQNTYPYNYITNKQAQELASKFETSGYETSLMFGLQWDLMLKYLETSEAATQSELITNSTSWGNYLNSTYTITNGQAKYLTGDGDQYQSAASYTKASGDCILLTTGARSEFSKKNISDIAGNAAEWILSYSSRSDTPASERGGNRGNNGDFRPAGDGGGNSPSRSCSFVSFRVTLYKDEGIGITAAYIPAGYTQVAGTNLDNGQVVQDSLGNQFVWIKVPRTATVYPTAGLDIESFTDAEYDAIEYDLNTYTSVYGGAVITDKYSDTYASQTGLTESEYYGLKKNMLKSIYINGGFYVGRYETGSTTARTSATAPLTAPVIKQNVYPYNYVNMVQAQDLASTFTTAGYKSGLLYGVQWDLIMKQIELSGEATQDQLKNDSTSFGNYYTSAWNVTNTSAKYSNSNGATSWTNGAYGSKAANTSILLSTGASETFKKQNIYDLAGNLWEYTMERFVQNGEERVSVRGNYHGSSGVVTSANSRGGIDPTPTSYRGFRVSLFKDEGVSLVRSYDASNLDGNGATGSSRTTIKDLTGTYDGTIYNSPTFGNGYIALNQGSSTTQYINIGPMLDLSKIIVNLKFSVSEIGRTHHLLGNWETGGFGFSINTSNKIGFAVRTESGTGYETVRSTTTVAANTMYDVTGIYDGQYLYIYVNGILEGTLETTGGNIKNPNNSIPTAIGGNPNASGISSEIAKMKLYSAKVWTAPAKLFREDE